MSQTLDQAYATAESITRDQARNFYYGIRLLAPAKRSALCAVYALARRIDDIGDGDLPSADKQQGLVELRAQLHESSTAVSTDPVLQAVHDVARRFPLPMGAFDELIDGVEMDITGRRYESFEELMEYCRCVAGSVGRLCLSVFGSKPSLQADGYADQLGIALQQTNILRDIREDLMNGRIYLPQQDLDRFGVRLRLDESDRLVDEGGALTELIRFSAHRAREWYADGLRLVPLLDRRSAACCAAMSGIYRGLLDQISANPSLVFDQRLSLSGPSKVRVAVRSLAGRTT